MRSLGVVFVCLQFNDGGGQLNSMNYCAFSTHRVNAHKLIFIHHFITSSLSYVLLGALILLHALQSSPTERNAKEEQQVATFMTESKDISGKYGLIYK